MKTAFRSKYGLPEVLSIKEVEKPTPTDDQVLIRVHAATASRTDCHVLWGKPLFMRLFTGLAGPKLAVTGTDFAGQIEATGKNVRSFKVGDKVIGFEFFGLKSHAYYLTWIPTRGIVKIPDALPYDEAVACVEGGFYALNCVRLMNPKPGQKALVYGASGAIGSAAVQLYKYYGTSVTAVCRGEHFGLMKSLGADKVIDYQTEDFTKDNERYDFIMDAVGKTTYGMCKPLLKEKGMYTSSGGRPENFLLPLVTPLLGGKQVKFGAPKDVEGCMSFIIDLVQKGNYKAVIDRRYPLDKIAEAFTYVGSGQKTGSVVITMQD